jgi:hypothetical protein
MQVLSFACSQWVLCATESHHRTTLTVTGRTHKAVTSNSHKHTSIGFHLESTGRDGGGTSNSANGSGLQLDAEGFTACAPNSDSVDTASCSFAHVLPMTPLASNAEATGFSVDSEGGDEGLSGAVPDFAWKASELARAAVRDFNDACAASRSAHHFSMAASGCRRTTVAPLPLASLERSPTGGDAGTAAAMAVIATFPNVKPFPAPTLEVGALPANDQRSCR